MYIYVSLSVFNGQIKITGILMTLGVFSLAAMQRRQAAVGVMRWFYRSKHRHSQLAYLTRKLLQSFKTDYFKTFYTLTP